MAQNTNNWYLSLLQDRYPDYTEGAFNQPQQQQNLGRLPIKTFAPPNPVARRPQQQPNILNELMKAQGSGQGMPPGTNPAALGALLGGLFPQPVNPTGPGVPTGGDADAQEGGFYGQMPMPDAGVPGAGAGYDYPVGGYDAGAMPPVPPEYSYFDQDLYG